MRQENSSELFARFQGKAKATAGSLATLLCSWVVGCDGNGNAGAGAAQEASADREGEYPMPFEGNSGTAGDFFTEDRTSEAASPEMIYEKVTMRSASGEVLSSSEIGSLDLDTWQRVSRPYTYFDEPYIYDETAIMRVEPNGDRADIYRVVRVVNQEPVEEELDERPIELTPELVAARGAASG